MELTAFTIAALAGAAVLFTVGVVLIWLGFRNRQQALPNGADDILDAIADGNLAPPSRREYGRDITGEHVRLVPAGTRRVAEPEPSAEPVARGGEVETQLAIELDAPEPDAEPDADPHDGDGEADDREPVGVGMLQSDDTGEMPAPARTFFSGQPELKRF